MPPIASTRITSGRQSAAQIPLVLGAGLVLGAFLSRVLAEAPWLTWPLYRRELTLALSLAVGLGFVVLWQTASRRSCGRHTQGTRIPGFLPVSSLVPFYALAFYLVQPTPSPTQAAVLLVGVLTLSALIATSANGGTSEWPIGLLLFLVPFAAYLATLMPAVGTRDGYELQAVSATLGFAHPTGYPLFPILGRLWISLFPFGSVAWRINVLCAGYAAASVPLIYHTARRILGHRSFAVLSALLFAFSPTWWAQASQPEKYTLNGLFVSLVLYVALGTVDPEERAPHPHLWWLAFVYGLSLTHHRTMLMLAPALALYILWRDPQLLKRPKEWAPALGIALAPLLIYLYIPWRAWAQGSPMSISAFLAYVSGSTYGPAIRPLDWLAPERARMFSTFTLSQFGYVGIALAALGWVSLGLGSRWRSVAFMTMTYLAYYVWGTVWYAYYNDVNSFVPNHMLVAIWIGHGAMALWKGLESLPLIGLRRNGPDLGPWNCAWAVFWSAVALLPMWMVWTNGPQLDHSHDWTSSRWGEYVVGLPIARGATVLADRDKYPPLDYYARIEGRRPDLDVAILGDEAAYLDRLSRDLSQNKSVYLARFLPGLVGRYHLRSLGPLVEVSTTPLTSPPPMEGVPTEWFSPTEKAAWIRLLGYQAQGNGTLFPQDLLRMTLFWEAASPVPRSFQVSLRLVSLGGQTWWASSDHPVNGMYPTTAWRPGEIIPDWHQVAIPAQVPPGTYFLQVGLFLPFSTEGLVQASAGPWLTLTTIDVSATSTVAIPRPLRAVAPSRWQLLGYDLPAQAPPTGRATLTLYWQALRRLPDYEIGTRWVSASGESDWTWSVPGRDEYPTSRWYPGDTVVTTHVLTMPGQEGKVTVQVAVRPTKSPGAASTAPTGSTEESVSFYPGWLAPRATILSFPPLSVAGYPPAAPGTANFSDRILLLDLALGQRTLLPGAPLELAVHWQCIRAMEADYTLFVHLLAPDGTLKGQIDIWPKNGTHPTGQWREGEQIADTYQVYLDQGAPSGSYQLEIGWYLLETMQRLPVLDASGNAVDDKVLVPGLTVAK